jgi:nucleoid-associated protein YgaU
MDIFVATETGDRLDTLAHQFYKDSTLWWIIASANNIHDAPIGFRDGTILRIPQNYIQIIANFAQI